jgi:hypothetical protein
MNELLPAVISAEYRSAYMIDLVFNDGTESTVDFAPWLTGPMFEPLKVTDYFQRFFIEGGTITWPNGADIAPETLHDRATSGGTASETSGGRRGLRRQAPGG